MEYGSAKEIALPASVQRAYLENAVKTAEELVRHALASLLNARADVEVFDQQVRRARARRSAAMDSMRLTEKAARACGLGTSASTRSSLASHLAAAEAAADEVRRIIFEARDACSALDSAHDDLRIVRAQQITVMQALANALEQAPDRDRSVSPRRRELTRAIATAEESLAREAAERQGDSEWLTDGHFDPRYDAREIALRRARPWV